MKDLGLKEQAAISAIAGIFVWWQNSSPPFGFERGITPEIASQVNAIFTLLFAWFFGILGTLQEGIAAIWQALTRKAVKELSDTCPAPDAATVVATTPAQEIPKP